MKFMVLTSAAFTVGQFWIAAQNWFRRRSGQPRIQRIASLDDLPVGGASSSPTPTSMIRVCWSG